MGESGGKCGVKRRWLVRLVCLPKGVSREEWGDYVSEALGKGGHIACGIQVESQPVTGSGCARQQMCEHRHGPWGN